MLLIWNKNHTRNNIDQDRQTTHIHMHTCKYTTVQNILYIHSFKLTQPCIHTCMQTHMHSQTPHEIKVNTISSSILYLIRPPRITHASKMKIITSQNDQPPKSKCHHFCSPQGLVVTMPHGWGFWMGFIADAIT